ncbi:MULTISPECIES: hypothetical protein [unclassified Tenacibaculum]|uniref:hypothetical protein n=1 Tax=unclassified Tenacibaculum TaxID=2635139 RepID=UPI001F4815CE|nr:MULTISPECIES: hypothetical protein [unclassified Tenacibaculum]MCF2875408.1 hypothetical protein [Tenacibaculum sp. Cn5-1]MCF2935484.1 hypothetical protein [Tenacibaculum sp. Cn5-34]MCG7512044.1 hypothetical protein [Tenacibaculum sp. Cn5-46]
MNKYTNNNANFAQKNAKNLSKIGVYNQLVRDYLSANKLDNLTQYAIKLFKDNAQRKKVTIAQYNKAVEEFNNQHGFLILKKGSENQTPNKYYSYINFPYLDRESIKATMDKYRQYVNKYNKQADEENEQIRNYNNTKVIHHYSLTDSQKKRKKEFETENNYLFVKQYNELVEKENSKEAFIPKKKLQKIKFQSEIIFHVLIGFYTSQLRTRNTYLMEMNRPTSTLKNSLPKLKIDHRKLATHKIADIPRLDICKKTAQNHVKRLREANILINYVRINQNKPVQVNINPQILEILDGKEPKSQTLENKRFSPTFSKTLHDNSDATRTNLKEKERKDCAKGTGLNKSGSMLEGNESNNACPADGYKGTKGINKINSLGRAEIKKILPNFLKPGVENSKVSGKYEVITQNFLSRLMDDYELAQKLANGEFDDYKGLRYSYLQQIAMYAHVNRDEFKKIILQDFIKSSAKIWKNHNVYPGEWKKTINALNEQFLENIVNKETLIKKLREYRWKLNFARKWFIKKAQMKALFPYKYFDKNRTQTNEIGFYGLHKVWLKNKKYKEQREQEKKRLEIEASAREREKKEEKRRISIQQKLTKAINKYESGKYTHEQLYSYVQDNLPHEYLLSLPNLINKNNQNLA